MPRLASALLLALCVVAAPAAPAPELSKETSTPPKKPPTPEQIAQAIRELGSGRFTVREAASKFLWEAGSAAESALREAAKSSDAEIAGRVKSILDRFDWGIYPDTPPKVVKIIEGYEKGTAEERAKAVPELMEVRPIPFKALRRFIAKEENPQLRQLLFEQMAEKARTEVPELLVRGDLRNAEELLETCVTGSTLESAADYAAFMYLSKRLDPAIERWEKARADGKLLEAARAAEVLVHLYKVKGDFKAARKAAAQAKNPELENDLLWEQGDWKELSTRAGVGDRGDPTGVRLALLRMSGNSAKFEEAVAEAIKAADDAEADPSQIQMTAEALLLNGRVDEGINLLAEKKVGMAMAFDLLCARMRHSVAFGLVKEAQRRDTEAGQRFDVETRRARMLHLLGEKESALQLFRKSADDLRDSPELSRARSLVRAELRSGLRDLAFDHAAIALTALAKANQHDGYTAVLEPLFDKKAEIADVWWRLLRQQMAKAEAPQVMQRVRDLLSGKATTAARTEAIGWMESDPDLKSGTDARVVHPVSSAWAIAEVYRAAADDKQADKYYLKSADAGGPQGWIRYGDFLFSRQRYREAAQQYHKAWDVNRGQPLPLYLEANALGKAGDDKEARRLTDIAHWVPLGNEFVRSTLVEELAKHDMPEAAQREAEMVLRTGWYRDPMVGNVLAHLARAASRNREFSKAADYYERALLGCLRTGARFVEPTGYLAVPEAVRINRALGLLGQKKFNEALALADANLKIMPGNIELVIPLVPELEKLGRKKEADVLYGRVKEVYEKLCADYPNSAFARNSTAWLMANCRRDLETARKHAEKAVELEPKNAGYLDTLAEVHFRAGNKDKAIELMKQCVALDEHNRYFHKQLERFKTKGPDSPTPDEGDDEE